jgi:hypothetical protein
MTQVAEYFRSDEVDWNTLRPKVGAGDSVLRLLSFAPAQQFSDVVQPSGEFPRIWLAPIGKRVLRYQPLEECLALFREFADIEQTPEGAQGFANKYGLLGGGKTARVDWILGESRRMSEAVLKWEEWSSPGLMDTI